MKTNGSYPWGRIMSAFAAFGLALTLTACPQVTDDPNQNGPTGGNSGITGRVGFANPSSSGTITVFLERTDGLHVETGTSRDSGVERAVSPGARSTVVGPDGSYSFNNVPEGVYTVFAVSGEGEQAILINVAVRGDSPATSANMTLLPPGNITGQIVLDDSDGGNLGFTVFIAGTSFMAVTNQAGQFTMSNVPANTELQIAVMRGTFATIWTSAVTQSGGTIDLGRFDVTQSQLHGDTLIWRGALSAHPENPQRNWSYFNTVTRRTYVFDGARWIVMGQVLTTSNVEYRGNGHTGGNPPIDPNPDGGYVFGATVTVMGQGTLVRAGYQFGGWSRDAGGGGRIYQGGETFVMGANPVVFYAVWLRLFTLTFNGNGHTGGTVPEAMQSVAGKTLRLPSGIEGTFVKTGYQFGGWSRDAGGGGRIYQGGETFVMGANPVVFYAVWIRLFTLTFNGNGHTSGTVPEAMQSVAGKTLVLADGVERTGYRFMGWNVNNNAATGVFTFTMGDSDVTLYAIWARSFTVTFVGNGHTSGTVPEPVSGITGEKIPIIPADITRTNFLFVGWNTSPDATGTAHIADIVIGSENITLYAIWSEFGFDPDSGTITSFKGTSRDIVIPATINNVQVTAIGYKAFYGRNLSSVNIPHAVTFGTWAFAGNQLTSVVIPEGVTEIGMLAFANNWLGSIDLPDSLISIDGGAFQQNYLASVSIPSGVTYIGGNAFSINMLTSIEIPPGVTSIEGYVFVGNQLTEIVIPHGVTYIGRMAFSRNRLDSVDIPDTVTFIGPLAFENNRLTSVVIPYGVTSIGESVFANNQLTSVVIPDTVTSIGRLAFENNRLTSVIIPNGIISIEEGVFARNQLTSIVIPDSVVFIRGWAFTLNTLTSITMPSGVNIVGDHALGVHDASFRAFYNENNRRAGTYIFANGSWSILE